MNKFKELKIASIRNIAQKNCCMELDDNGVLNIKDNMAIYAVRLKDSFKFKIFIGEKPVQNDKGEWVATNPNTVVFVTNERFKGSHHVKDDCPYSILLVSENFMKYLEKKNSDLRKKADRDIHFKEWVKSKWFRTKFWYKTHFPYFIYFAGTKSKMIKFILPFVVFSTEYVWSKDGQKKYFCISTVKYNRFLNIKDRGKWCFVYNKYENDGTCCSL